MQQNKLNVVLCWHMHQPQYRCNNIYSRPWTWLHAIKDYNDMAALFMEEPPPFAELVERLDELENSINK